ncbi:hypothetical protein AAGG74_15115 [Bacillus mexicanus]|uniref:hypothetical protein n=1 Tax=Bacillus mexicanus TaxID=2834415 RepID=UPI003D1BD4AC
MIQGVTEIETRTLKSFNVKLDKVFTNGHDFCELLVDEKNNSFIARLYGGETYTFRWNSPGDDFIQYLINTFSKNSDYLYDKLEDVKYREYIDTEKTAINMKKVLLSARLNRELDKEDARELWDEIESFSCEALTIRNFYDIYHNQFKTGIKSGVFSDEPWYEEFVVNQEDYQCRVFCEKVAPILAQVLKQEQLKN